MIPKRLAVRPSGRIATDALFEAGTPQAEPLRRKPVTILFVEDNEDLRFAVAGMLKTAGYEVTQARNGKEGLENFSAGFFDLVISDLYMPLMGGVDMFHEMRRLRPQTRVIFLGGYFPDNSVDALTDSGAAMMLSKPVTLSELKHAIEQALASGT